MNTKLFIPNKLKIGFQKRQNTYTGNLGYVIYQDEKNVWRKEKSWDGWRDKSIDAIEIDNTATSGFVLNKGLQRVSYHWGSGRSVVRVYDPRDFEFEISVDNLLGILTHSDVSKREIDGQMVFAWAGTELVLLPINSEAYEESVKFTEQQDKKISTKNLIPGKQYINKKQGTMYVYIGFYNFWKLHNVYGEKTTHINTGKKHIFCAINKQSDGKKIFDFSHPSISTLCEFESTELDPKFAEMTEQFFSCIHSQPIVGIRFEDAVIEKRIYSMNDRIYELRQSFYIKNSETEFYKIGFYSTDYAQYAHYLSCVNFDRGSLEIIEKRNQTYHFIAYKQFALKVGDTYQKLKYILENGKEIYVD